MYSVELNDTNDVLTNYLSLDPLKKSIDYMLYKYNIIKQEIDDVKQDIFLRIIAKVRKKPEVLDYEPFRFVAYCNPIIKRAILDYLKKSKSRKNKVLYFGYYDYRKDMDSNTPFETPLDFLLYPVKDIRYSLVEVKMDYIRHRNKFTKNEQKVLDFLLFDPSGLDLNYNEIAEKVKVHKSSVTRAVIHLRSKIYRNNKEEYADYNIF